MDNNFDAIRMSGLTNTRVDSKFLMILLDALEPYLIYHTYPTRKRFSINQNDHKNCYLIRKGSVSYYRQPNDILIEIFESPTIRGVISAHENSLSLYMMQVVESAEIAILDKEIFYSLLREHNLWEPFAMHLQLVATVAAEVIFKLVSTSAYELVCFQLCELMSKPLALRESIAVEDYIRGKTHLSRSSILNTLSALKKTGSINIEKGHLIEIKWLPSQF